MKISSLYKQAVRTIQFSLAAIICSIALNFGTAAPSLAAQVKVPTPHLALFGLGEKAEGKAEELAGKAQAKTGKKIEGASKQIKGQTKYEIGRAEKVGERMAEKAGKVAKNIKNKTDKNISKAEDSIQNTANNLVDGARKKIGN